MPPTPSCATPTLPVGGGQSGVAWSAAVLQHACQAAHHQTTTHTHTHPLPHTGLAPAELGQVHNYLHFRPGYSPLAEDIAKRLDTFDEALDIFQSVGEDTPTGVWSVQAEGGERVAIVKSLQWPGVVFFHARATPTAAAKFGGLYFGTGQKNQNIGYML